MRLLACCLVIIFTAVYAESSRLGTIGSNLRSYPDTPGSESRHRSRSTESNDYDRDDDPSFGDLVFFAIFPGIFTPFRNIREASRPCYAHRPYDDYDYTPSPSYAASQPWPWNGSVGFVAGRVDDQLAWWGVDARLVSPVGLGIATEMMFYREEIDDSGEGISARLQDVSLLWRQFESPQLIWDIQVGYLGFVDDIGQEGGISIGTDLTLMPLRPAMLHGSLAAGTINGLPVYRHELGVGLIYHGAELRVGHRWTKIDGIDLSGYQLGLHWWF